MESSFYRIMESEPANVVRGKEFSYDDTVFKFCKEGRIKFGLVVDTGDDYDSDDSVFSITEMSALTVEWDDGNQEIISVENQKNIFIAHRAIDVRDIVQRKADANYLQGGSCVKLRRSVDVKIKGTSFVIKNVSTARLHRPIYPNEKLMMDSWVGITTKVRQQLVLKLQCGALVQVPVTELYNFRLVDPHSSHSVTMFYPGQTLMGTTKSFKNEKWLTPKPSLLTTRKTFFVVESVEVEAIWVSWLLNTNSDAQGDQPDSRPEKVITGEDLKRIRRLPLECNENRIGSTHFLTVNESDLSNLTSNKKWTQELRRRYENSKAMDILSPVDVEQSIVNGTTLASGSTDDDGWETDGSLEDSSQLPSRPPKRTSNGKKQNMKSTNVKSDFKPPNVGDTIVIETALVYSYLTVVWQDGTIEPDVPSTQLVYALDMNDFKFFPGECVASRSVVDDGKYGIVQNYNSSERVVTVKWFKKTSDVNDPEFINETEVSFYDLKYHDNFHFRMLAEVIKIGSLEGKEHIDLGKVIHTGTDGRVEVRWIDGNSSMHWPQEIFSVYSFSRYNNCFLFDAENEGDSLTVLGKVLDLFQENLQGFIDDLSEFRSNIDDALDVIDNVEKSQQIHLIDNQQMRFVEEIVEKGSIFDRLMNTSFFSSKTTVNRSTTTAESNFGPNATEGSLVQTITPSSDQTKNGSNDSMSPKELQNHENAITTEPPIENVNSTLTHKNLHMSTDGDKNNFSAFSTVMKAFREALLEMKIRLKSREVAASSEIVNVFEETKELDNNQNDVGNDTTVSNNVDNGSDQEIVIPQLTGGFVILESAPTSHNFQSKESHPTNFQQFFRAVKSDHKILKTSLPPGVQVRAFEDRIDLLSVLMEGPKGTPYEDGIFLFDVHLSDQYPSSPPSFHYVSFSKDSLNPNLYVDGKVCVSLLNTWNGKGSEVWGPGCTLLQVLVSIQGLILVAEPFFNEPDLEKQKGTTRGSENSKLYNEVVVLKLVESMAKLVENPPELFRDEIIKHFRERGDAISERIDSWMNTPDKTPPEFPLVPVSRGFSLSMNDALGNFESRLAELLESATI